MIKGQDVLVLAALMHEKVEMPRFADVADRAKLSISETHAAVKRLQSASLIDSNRRAIRRNVSEFLIHALKYEFPIKTSRVLSMGMPTSYAAPVAADEFSFSGYVPVWPCSKGSVPGLSFEPVYPTVPSAAEADRGMYDRLAVFDMLRAGRIRERKFAELRLQEMFA